MPALVHGARVRLKDAQRVPILTCASSRSLEDVSCKQAFSRRYHHFGASLTDPLKSQNSSHAALAAAVARGARSQEGRTTSSYEAPSPTPGFKRIAADSARSRPAPAQSLWHRNRLSLTAFGVVAAYIVLAEATGVVLLGIFPAMLGLRALRRKERLAPLALVAAGIAVVFAITVISHH